MSHHRYNGKDEAGTPVYVLMGYDRPLDYVFMTVEARNGLMLYSNLADPDAEDCQNVRYFEGVLKEMNLAVPETMFREVERDQKARAGNRTLLHFLSRAPADGALEP